MAVTFICKTPDCGEDVTAEVIRKLKSGSVEMRMAEPAPIDPVIVKCPKGHVHSYP
jgi:hypothetical protein